VSKIRKLLPLVTRLEKSFSALDKFTTRLSMAERTLERKTSLLSELRNSILSLTEDLKKHLLLSRMLKSSGAKKNLRIKVLGLT
jgi:hypothetical protein